MLEGKILVLSAETLEFTEVKFTGKKVPYELLSEGVAGLIEHVTFNRKLQESKIDVWCNEEGKLMDLKVSALVVLDGLRGGLRGEEIVEQLVGNLVFSGSFRNSEGEIDSCGLSEKQILLIKETLTKREVYMYGKKTDVYILPYK